MNKYLFLILLMFFAVSINAQTNLTDEEINQNFFSRQPAEIVKIDREQVLELTKNKIDIDSVKKETILVWINENEFNWIKSKGWVVKWIPNEAKIYRDKLKEETQDSKNPMKDYHTYDEMVAELENHTTSYPNLCRLESIGKSVQGRDLWFMKITDNPDVEEAEPEFKYISTMHGDEVVGMEMCLYLIDYLLSEYETNSRIKSLVDETEIWIMPLMNPDGFEAGSRSNANGIDLNRNFPDRVIGLPEEKIQPETQAIMDFGEAHSSVMSANFHTGALLVNYPYDSTFYPHEDYHPDWYTPDNDVFVNHSLEYSIHNQPMYENTNPYIGTVNGIVNGITWYIAEGGMQDYNYVWLGCNEVTIELSYSDMVPVEQLSKYWDNNRESMLSYMEKVHTGVRGIVTDSFTGEPLEAEIQVEGRDHKVYSDGDVGDYYRLLLPGTYNLIFEAEGYPSKTVSDVIVNDGTATVLNVQMGNTLSVPNIWIYY